MSADPEARERLRRLATLVDGREVAELDLALRGPGEVAGIRQAGLPEGFLSAAASHEDLLRPARAEAERLLRMDPGLSAPEHGPLRAEVERRYFAGAQGFIELG